MPPTDVQRTWVFWEWCVRQEVRSFPSYAYLLGALVVALEFRTWPWIFRWHLNQGRELFEALYVAACMLILLGGGRLAGPAVCAEVSSEMRELVRLTGIRPLAMLWCRMLARWSTVGCMLLIMVPGVCLARTLGGVSATQLYACACGLLLLFVLTAGMAAVAGVSTVDSENAPTTAAILVFLLMLIYHSMFGFTSLFIALVNWWLTGDFFALIPLQTWQRVIYNFALEATPLSALIRAAQIPESFSPLAPSYWIHFVAAFFCFRMAAVVMRNRFRSLRTSNDVSSEHSGSSTQHDSGRPRCTDDPLFWKDAHVLSKGRRSQRRWDLAYGLIAGAVLAVGLLQWNAELILGLGIIAECLWPVSFAVRADALLAAEFRHKTWESLMLLPIDRRHLLMAKWRAVAWEHRASAIPVLIAVAFALPRAPAPVAMIGVIALLAGLIFSQFSVLVALMPRILFSGVLVFLIVGCVILWVTLDPWRSFCMTVALMVFISVASQMLIHHSLKNWDESYLSDNV